MWPGQIIGTFDFTCRRRVNFNPCISASNQHFEKQKKWSWIRVLGMYHKNFIYLSWVESKEVARPTICGFHIQKSHFSGVFFAVYSGTAHEIMVPATPPNTHPRPHLMPKEPTDMLNWYRRWTISGVQNVTLYCKIDKVIQLFWWLYKWSLAQGLYKSLEPLFLHTIEPEISTPEKSARSDFKCG